MIKKFFKKHAMKYNCNILNFIGNICNIHIICNYLNSINLFYKNIITYCIILFIFLYKTSYGFEFYEIDSPYEKQMKKQYRRSVSKKNDDSKINLKNIENTRKTSINALYAEQLETEKQNEIEEKMIKTSKRQNFIKNYGTETGNDDTRVQKKMDAKSFLDKWIIVKDKNPMDVSGPYTSFKLMFTYPVYSSVNVRESVNTSSGIITTDIFSANAHYHIMPSFFVSVGNDQFKFWRWELEFGYIPILASRIGNFYQYDGSKTLNVSKKDLSVHLAMIALNNYYQHAFFDGKIVGFIGLGIGVGGGWSMGSTIGSDFVMPIVKGSVGFSMLVGKTAKLNIAYVMLYSTMKLPSKYTFIDSGGGSSPAIRGGTIDFGRLIINGISIEYQFSIL